MNRLEKAIRRVEHIRENIVTCGSDRTAFSLVVEAARKWSITERMIGESASKYVTCPKCRTNFEIEEA